MITSLYRPRTLFEALRDIAHAAGTIWCDYRHERGYQRAMKRRVRSDLRDFEIRCGTRGAPARPVKTAHRSRVPVILGYVVAFFSFTEILHAWPLVGGAIAWFSHLAGVAVAWFGHLVGGAR